MQIKDNSNSYSNLVTVIYYLSKDKFKKCKLKKQVEKL